MRAFALLLERLAFTPQRNGKRRVLVEYLRSTPDPDRGYALAALCGELDLRTVTPSLLRTIASERMDEQLMALSYDFVGDLAETIALAWETQAPPQPPQLHTWIERLRDCDKRDLPRLITHQLDRLDSSSRYACLKLATGGLRVGVSARLARIALADYAEVPLEQIEELWHGLTPPYLALFDWLDGGEMPQPAPAAFRPVMLSVPVESSMVESLALEEFQVEWKWDGIRVQAVVEGEQRKLYSRTGEDISDAFPDVIGSLDGDAVLDGELLVQREGVVQRFSELQKRLNRKQVSRKLLHSHPAFMRVYDVLLLEGEDLRGYPLRTRRSLLERWFEARPQSGLDLSPVLNVEGWEALDALRSEPPSSEIEGVMLKRLDSPYLAGRIKGHWYKWKREPMLIDAVLLYAQRGHGKRSGYYSDFTFGAWDQGELVPVGKAYFGFTDEELVELDRFVRNHTVERFGPVRRVEPSLVLEIAFEGLARSGRHKSGVAMRFPRISRIRRDKPAHEADSLDTLKCFLDP